MAIPEKKVLDTWATSSLTPQIASSLVGNKIKIPYSLRPQAHDIIRTWAFYTIVKAYLHEKKIPWKDIMVSGFVRIEGEKMGKSKGNVVDPKIVMNKYGADALRFWAAGSKLGEDLNYQEKDLIAGKRFITKLQNASKFVFMNLKGYDGKKPKKLEKIDELFLRELNRTIDTTTDHFKEHNYARTKFNAEEFFWKFFTDYYLEIVKQRVYKGKGNKKLSAQYTLYTALLAIVKMFAPITPFITEEIYQQYFRKFEKDKSIHISKWPEYNIKMGDKWIEKDMGPFANRWVFLSNLISKIRQEKTKAKKSMNAEITLTLDKNMHKRLEPLLDDLKDVTNAKKIIVGKFKVRFVK